MNIYIACGLTHVPRDEFPAYVQFIETLAARLSELGTDTITKYALRDSDPQLAERSANERAQLCYLWDRAMVEEASLVVAEASFPSIGLGIELQIAAARGTPVVLCFREHEAHRASPAKYQTPDQQQHDLQIGEGYVSLMALGLPTLRRVIPYGDAESGVTSIVAAVIDCVDL